MTMGLVSLPMYVSHRAAVEQLWVLIAAQLQANGVANAPSSLTWPADLHAHWLNPNLVLSQTCGYPFIDDLAGKVQLIGCFHYDAPGCEGITCQSALIARDEHAALALEEFRGLRAAFNVANSQSGYNAFRARIAPLSQHGKFFSTTLETGSHRLSVDAVRTGLADLASIDCVTYAGFKRYSPEAVQGLHVVGYTDTYAGLPLITAGKTPAHDLQTMQAVLASLFSNPLAAPALKDLGIVGFETPSAQIYQRCIEMREAAIALGYPRLA
jgi:ABC-type phosphate/phosphonate transport system substrate-binding protein